MLFTFFYMFPVLYVSEEKPEIKMKEAVREGMGISEMGSPVHKYTRDIGKDPCRSFFEQSDGLLMVKRKGKRKAAEGGSSYKCII